ncbi:MAG: hypothetical protein QT05_C0038G0007 [archaeon GW2011_AR13]|nr:MAG: hypothetical protein QT05_C0038G0007 [archaeon GW2011_AR13]
MMWENRLFTFFLILQGILLFLGIPMIYQVIPLCNLDCNDPFMNFGSILLTISIIGIEYLIYSKK